MKHRHHNGGKTLWDRLFKFLASVNLAMFLLAALIVVFAAGTIIESKDGAEAAKILIYDSTWFSFLLLLLAVNLVASALDRLPWEKRHIGFVMTHLGIIIVLIGSFVTKTWMIDGQMAVTEGHAENRIFLPEPVLYFVSEDKGTEWLAKLPRKAFRWQGESEIPLSGKNVKPPFSVSLLHAYPKGRLHEKIVQAERGPAAVQVQLASSMMQHEQWLLENSPEFGAINLGPAVLSLTGKPMKKQEPVLQQDPYLEFQFPEKTVTIPVTIDQPTPAIFKLEGTPYQITIEKLYRYAVIVQNELTERPNTEASPHGHAHDVDNPAAVLLLEGDGLKEKHTIFARFPDFPTIHGKKPSDTGVKIFYRVPDMMNQGPERELRLIPEEEELKYQVKNGNDFQEGKVALGEVMPTGWMDLTFQVKEYFAHSKMERTFTPEPNSAEGDRIYPAVEIKVKAGEEIQTLWVAQGISERLEIGGQSYHAIYTQKTIPLPFAVALRDFKLLHYPGTNRPASYESDVTLKDDYRGVKRDLTISMNEPMDYGGYRFFQSSYIQQPGQPEVSIFSVVRDPGIFLKYSGTVILITGTLWMFFTGRFQFRKGAKKE